MSILNRLLAFLLVIIALLPVSIVAQNTQSYLNDTGNPAYSTSIPVENGYINISNGNLHLEFPFASLPQRGTVRLNERLVYDSRIWMFSPFGTHGHYHWWPTNVAGSSSAGAGWRFISGNEIGQITYTNQSISSTECNPDDRSSRGEETNSISWTEPGGITHPFYATQTFYVDQCANTTQLAFQPGYAADGSGYYAANDGAGSPVIIDGNGTQVYPQIIDRYGNYQSSDSQGNLIDNVGRTPVLVTQKRKCHILRCSCTKGHYI